jgi:phosphate transport system substrate-binding protein
VQIKGAGVAFANDTFQTWGYVYPAAVALNRGVRVGISYNAVGSSEGVSQLTQDSVWFGASDESLLPTNTSVRTLPILVAAVALVFNVPGLSALVLSQEAVVGIFNGTITSWTHPLLVSLNPSLLTLFKATSPALTVFIRADQSGTTEVLTGALSSFDANFSATYGTFKESLRWPALRQRNAVGEDAVALSCIQTPYSIGYAKVSSAMKYSAHYAMVLNRNGNATSPDNIAAVESAAKDFQSLYPSLPKEKFFVLPVNGRGALSYPIVGFTYLVLQMGYPSVCSDFQELFRYIRWILQDPTATATAAVSYLATIPDNITPFIWPILADFTCPDGSPVLQTVNDMIAAEGQDKSSILVQICISAIVGVVACLFLAQVALLLIRIARERRKMSKSGAPNNSKEKSAEHKKKMEMTTAMTFKSIVAQDPTDLGKLGFALADATREVLLSVINWYTYATFSTMGSPEYIFCVFASLHAVGFVLKSTVEVAFPYIQGYISPVLISFFSKRWKPSNNSDLLSSSISKNSITKQNTSADIANSSAPSDSEQEIEVEDLVTDAEPESPKNEKDLITKGVQMATREMVLNALSVLGLFFAEIPICIVVLVIGFALPFSSPILYLCYGGNMFSMAYKLKGVVVVWDSYTLYKMGSKCLLQNVKA